VLELIALILPFILLTSTWLAFRFFRKKFGEKKGYFFGFMFYWLFWCLLVPKIFLSGNEIRELFSCDIFLFLNKNCWFEFYCPRKQALQLPGQEFHLVSRLAPFYSQMHWHDKW